MKRKALRAAFPYTLSIWVEFLFLGLSYGLLMKSMGLPIFYILAMSIFIFAGSMEFVTVNLLVGPFQPLNAFIMTLMVNARHLFYGLAMLGKYRDTGWKKGYLIFGMCDETFALNSAITPPEGVDRGWFYFFITLLDQIYWVSSGALGYLVGSALPINTTGVDFILTALITVLFLGQLEGKEKQRSGWMGLGIAMVVLGTVTTRFLPFAIFPEGKKLPDAIVRLGRVLPAAVMGFLVIYCLKDALFTAYYGLPELISLACVVVVHLWKRNMVLSLVVGTVLHMVLVQCCFV